MGYTFLLQNSDLVITTLMGAIADNIGGSTIHACLIISIKNRNEKLNTIFNLWTAQL